MKIIITILVTITGLVALPNKAEARPYSHSGSSYTYRSGHASCGCAIYTKRILSGYDHCRQPIYRYCGVPIVHRCHSKRSHYSSSYGHQSGHYGHDAMTLSDDAVKMRMNAHKWVEEVRGTQPGLDNVYVLFVAPFFGLRGGRCIEGAYTMTYVDARAGQRFADVVCMGQWKKARAVDYPDGRPIPKDERPPAEIAPPADFPLRAMIPKEMNGLVAVGRSASSIPDIVSIRFSLRKGDPLIDRQEDIVEVEFASKVQLRTY